MHFQYILLNEKKEIVTAGSHSDSKNLFPILKNYYSTGYYIVRYSSFSCYWERMPVNQRRVNIGRVASFDPVKKRKSSLIIHTLKKGSEDYDSLLSIFKTWRFINGYTV